MVALPKRLAGRGEKDEKQRVRKPYAVWNSGQTTFYVLNGRGRNRRLLRGGSSSRLDWKTDTARSQTDKTAVSKYDSTQEADYGIVLRVNELAQKYGATMTQIALAWQFAKGITAPIIGATKPEYFDDAVGAFGVKLTAEDVAFLEEPYVPHKIVGAL